MDNQWYLAEILEEIHVADQANCALHVNLILVNAKDAEEAYTKALRFGEDANTEYPNTGGVLVTCTFRGLRNLYEIYEDLADGAEILYERHEDLTQEDIQKIAKAKDQLAVFRST